MKKGSKVRRHFEIMAWLLEGPARTRKDLCQRFHTHRDDATLYINTLVDLKKIEFKGFRPTGSRGQSPAEYGP